MALDRFLMNRLGLSRKQAKRRLDERGIFVNRRRVWMAHHPLRRGDLVELAGAARSTPAPAALRILHEDGACVVVDKPAGMPSTGPDSAESRLRSRDPGIRPVHRLDRDTSGCLLFARTEAARAALESQFEAREIDKVYQAIVIGPFPPTLARIERPLEGLSALTECRLLRRNADAAYIEARPRTGRTHQVRLHLQAAGYPLAGDRAYATRAIHDERLRQLSRQMLHAWRIAWRDPASGEPRRAQAALPPDFRDALALMRLAPARVKRGGGT